ncbi:MAG: hypothetical protein ACLGSH_19590 [Acidobacteriota bacterium]
MSSVAYLLCALVSGLCAAMRLRGFFRAATPACYLLRLVSCLLIPAGILRKNLDPR